MGMGSGMGKGGMGPGMGRGGMGPGPGIGLGAGPMGVSSQTQPKSSF